MTNVLPCKLFILISIFRNASLKGRKAHNIQTFSMARVRQTLPPGAQTPFLTRGCLKRSFRIDTYFGLYLFCTNLSINNCTIWKPDFPVSNKQSSQFEYSSEIRPYLRHLSTDQTDQKLDKFVIGGFSALPSIADSAD